MDDPQAPMPVPLQTFRSPQEVQIACPRLDTSCVFEIEQYDNVVGPYRFQPADWVLCQMKKKHGPCTREHGNGWVVIQKNGAQVYVGNCCARDYLKGIAKFGTDKNRVRKEQRVGGLNRRLAAQLANSALPVRIRTLSERQRSVRHELTAFRDLWPLSLLKRLHDISRTGSHSVVVEVQFLERDEEGKLHSKWEPRNLGTISGAAVMNTSTIRDVGTRLSAATAALREAASPGDHTEGTMKKWVDALDAVDGCESDLELLHSAMVAFQRPENLRMLCWAVRSDSDQLLVVGEYLRTVNGFMVSTEQARRTLNAWRNEIVAKYNAHGLRVP